MNVERIREDFPTTRQLIYLATCAEAPPLKPMLDELWKAWDEKTRNGSIMCQTDVMLQLMEEGRKCASEIIGSEKDEIAFVRGNNDAMNTISTMLDWKKGDNVILNDMEYAGGVVPWMRQRVPHGIDVRCVRNRSGAVLSSDIEDSIDEHTKAISICHVHTANGYRNDLEAIGRIARKHGIYFVVNASQSMGAVEIDVRKMNIDFITCSAYKWALGPPGTGLMYVRKELLDRFEPPFVGIGQEKTSIAEPNFNYHEYSPEILAKTARKFDYGGHQNPMGIIGLVKALKYIDRVGIDNIVARDAELLDYSVRRLKELDVDLPSWIEDKSHRSSFLGFGAKMAAKLVLESLRKKKIIVAMRMGYAGEPLVRVAPHFFNTEDEIATFASVLGELLKHQTE
mgnify:CR=1 FL=1